MESAIEKLNNKICEEYTVEISCDRSKMRDVYEEGEVERVYWTSDFYKRSSDTNPHNLSLNLKEGIENVLRHYTQYSTFEEYMREGVDEAASHLVVCRHINGSCNDPSFAEVEMWKKGEVDLYRQYTFIKVRINSALIDANLIIDLIKGE